MEQYLDKILGRLGDIATLWFHQFAGIVAYDGEHDKFSQVVIGESVQELAGKLKDILKEKYKSKTQLRDYLQALSEVVKHDKVLPGSPVYIIGDSGIEDHETHYETLLDNIAIKHVTVSIL